MCATYGWTVEHTLAMPARQFFTMLDQARRIKALDRIDDCHIAMIANADARYFDELVGSFRAQIPARQDLGPDIPVIEQGLEGDDARNALGGLFG